jgi:hypothetical protein
MPLDKTNFENTLAGILKINFAKGKDEEWSSDKAAEELAKAIADTVDVFVRGGDVQGVVTEVRNVAGTTVIGGGQQTNITRIT